MESAWRQSNYAPEKKPPQLEEVECPDEFKYILQWFWLIGARRNGNGFSANPISNLEMMAWGKLHDVQFTLFEVEVLDRCEQIYIMRLQQKAEADKNEH